MYKNLRRVAFFVLLVFMTMPFAVIASVCPGDFCCGSSYCGCVASGNGDNCVKDDLLGNLAETGRDGLLPSPIDPIIALGREIKNNWNSIADFFSPITDFAQNAYNAFSGSGGSNSGYTCYDCSQYVSDYGSHYCRRYGW